MTVDTLPRWVGIPEVAAAFDISERTCRHLASTGQLPIPGVKLGVKWRFSADQLHALAAAGPVVPLGDRRPDPDTATPPAVSGSPI